MAGASATMSVDGAARYLGISRSHAYDLVRAGEIPHLNWGVGSSFLAVSSTP